MAYTYILKCSDASYYVGSAENIDNRLKKHQRGLSAYTKTRLPIELVYSEEYPTKEEAAKREYQIKRWSHAKKEALINGDFERLKQLCRSQNI